MTTTMIDPTDRDLDRFRASIRSLPNGCIVWAKQISRQGYGHFYAQGRCIRAHKFSYVLSSGNVPAGLVIDHLCGNRACVNPFHLEAVTPRENVLRSPHTAARINHDKTHCPKGHPYAGDNLMIRNSGIRECRECGRRETARYIANNREEHNARRRASRAHRRANHA